MAASPGSARLYSELSDSDGEGPATDIGKSFMTNIDDNDDENDNDDNDDLDGDSKMETTESAGRKGKSKSRDPQGPNGGSMVGKIRHLKKEDGQPLWRRDIQYDFLKAVFEDPRAVFTNSYEPSKPKQCFADLYIDTMSRSSKTSKVLRDKLLSDRDAAKSMAMVCLLVNIGRMNTTLNFFPEMRAQLRTYHSIPSLQAHQDPHAYKQLQDAPRLKSILKGGAEDRREPQNLDRIKQLPVPRTNPVNLLFVVCQGATKVAELHFPPGQEFHDLIMKTNYTSESRACAFLWIMWFYLESDFTEEGCDENPFGAGVDYGIDVANQGVPQMTTMTKEEEDAENIDPPDETEFGKAKQAMRAKIIEADQVYMNESTSSKRTGRAARVFVSTGEDGGPSAAILPRIRPSKHESDMDSTRSTPPPRAFGRGKDVFGSSNRRGNSLKYQIFEASSPGGPQGGEGGGGTNISRKPRPPTAHQLAVEQNRNQRVNHILDRGLRRQHRVAKRQRKTDGAIIRAINRIRKIVDPLEDSGDEDNGGSNRVQYGANGHPLPPTGNALVFRDRGMGGLALLQAEDDDFGEEAAAYTAAMRRAARRLDRWHGVEGGPIAPIRRIRAPGMGSVDDYKDPNETEEELEETYMDMDMSMADATPAHHRGKSNGHLRAGGRMNGDAVMDLDDEDDLDDDARLLIGVASDGEGEREGESDADNKDVDEDLDDEERLLAGIPHSDSDSE